MNDLAGRVFIVEEVFSVTGQGTFVSGKLDRESGIVRVGDEIGIRRPDHAVVATGPRAIDFLVPARQGVTPFLLSPGVSAGDVSGGDAVGRVAGRQHQSLDKLPSFAGDSR